MRSITLWYYAVKHYFGGQFKRAGVAPYAYPVPYCTTVQVLLDRGVTGYYARPK